MARPLTAYERRIFEFMDARDYTRGHVESLHAVEAHLDEIRAEAGPNGPLCPITQQMLGRVEAHREEIIRRAVERYEDWASD